MCETFERSTTQAAPKSQQLENASNIAPGASRRKPIRRSREARVVSKINRVQPKLGVKRFILGGIHPGASP
jgi:hypothetical protein